MHFWPSNQPSPGFSIEKKNIYLKPGKSAKADKQKTNVYKMASPLFLHNSLTCTMPFFPFLSFPLKAFNWISNGWRTVKIMDTPTSVHRAHTHKSKSVENQFKCIFFRDTKITSDILCLFLVCRSLGSSITLFPFRLPFASISMCFACSFASLLFVLRFYAFNDIFMNHHHQLMVICILMRACWRQP